MFKRSKPQLFVIKIRNYIWPDMGIRRYVRYVKYRFQRLRGTPYYLAAGLAIGFATSMLPLISLHVLLTLLICVIVRASILTGIVGTLAGNPWTFPLIFFIDYRLGKLILGGKKREITIIEDKFSTQFDSANFLDTLKRMITNPRDDPFLVDFYFPTMIGGLLMAVVTGIVVYIFAYFMFANFHKMRLRRIRRRKDKLLHLRSGS